MREPSIEDQVLSRAMAGDGAAFEELFMRYRAAAWAVARRITGDREVAAELVQEAFLRVHQARASFRAGERFEPWLFRILANLCLNQNRRRRDLPLGDGHVSAQKGPDAIVEARDREARLERAFAELPERYRTALTLRVHAGMSTAEIGRVLDCPEATVRTLLFRARELLRAKTGGDQ